MYIAAISNLAWLPSEGEQALRLMKQYAVGGLEIAPKKIWEDPDLLTEQDAVAWRDALLKKHIRPIAMQGFLFGRKDCSLFEGQSSRERLFLNIKRSMHLARVLGVKTMIFGSPASKVRGSCPINEADTIAIDFFRDVGNLAQEHHIHFCIEATPEIYGSDYIISTPEAASLIARIDHPNINLNLDFGTLKHEGKFDPESISEFLPITRHIHVSELLLKAIDMHDPRHQPVVQVLIESGYSNAVSIEMLHVKTMKMLEEIISWFSQVYVQSDEAKEQ